MVGHTFTLSGRRRAEPACLALLLAASFAFAGAPAAFAQDQDLQLRGPLPEEPIKGGAQFSSIIARAGEIRTKLQAGCRFSGFKCVRIEVKNDSSDVITLYGDRAKAQIDGKVAEAVSEEELKRKSGCGTSLVDDALILSVSAVTAGLAGPIFHDIVHPDRYPQSPYGIDRARWLIEGFRLGRRLLLPGDDTAGLICFECGQDAHIGPIMIPAQSPTESGLILIQSVTAKAGQAPQ